MYNVEYRNNFMEKVNFVEWPYMLTGGNLFDGKWDSIENDDHIQGWEKRTQNRLISMDISGTGLLSFEEAMNRLEDVFEKDVISGRAGRLYVGKSYMNCFLSMTEKDRWINDLGHAKVNLQVTSDYPYWITECPYTFRKKSESVPLTSSLIGLDYEHDYEYEYVYGFSEGNDGTLQYMVNDHYTDSGFKMTIYGPCINPAIRIAGHLYELRTVLYDGEYAVVDSSTRFSQDRAIYKVQVDGTVMDLFNARNKSSEIWKKIPHGRSTVTWNGDFGFDIVLFSERGTPSWILR